MRSKKILFFLISVSILFLLTACSKEPEPIEYGSDSCSNCRMLITDQKFGSEIVTDKGKIFKFDSIECMANFYSTQKKDENFSLWVTDFNHPKKFIDADKAFFLRSDKIKSPMGMNLAAFSNKNEQDKAASAFNGTQINWKELVDYVKNNWD